MTRVKATCEDCGDVELFAVQFTVRHGLDLDALAYRFRCPSCTMTTVRDVDKGLGELLVSAGAQLEFWRMPAELAERRAGAPVTHDDLLEFHRLLQDEDLLAAFAQG